MVSALWVRASYPYSYICVCVCATGDMEGVILAANRIMVVVLVNVFVHYIFHNVWMSSRPDLWCGMHGNCSTLGTNREWAEEQTDAQIWCSEFCICVECVVWSKFVIAVWCDIRVRLFGSVLRIMRFVAQQIERSSWCELWIDSTCVTFFFITKTIRVALH